MQVVRMMGGLGNQMFSYAFALALQKRGHEVAIDTTWYDQNKVHNGWELGRLFKLDIPECDGETRERLGDINRAVFSRLRRKIFGPWRGHIIDHNSGYDAQYLAVEGDAYFDGFWQSPRYHEGINTDIERLFRFPVDLEPEAKSCLDAISPCTKIGVHVRRGDYLESETLGGVCGEAYYLRAMSYLSGQVASPVILFFSDDLDWCRDHLGYGCDAIYIDWNRDVNSWRDMRLMTLCDRLAISNSSFGWWGARLGCISDRMIVAPDRWFGGKHMDNPDITLSQWIRFSTAAHND